LSIFSQDFVYLAPDVSNELYYVGRVLEFVPPPKQHPGKQHMSVRIGWFYRPKDVLPGGKKKNHDPRLLLASMHSDINPVTSIRGKCEIMHIHHIADLDKWKAKDDTFYYDQLYDRYTHRVYDVVPLELVRNLPDEVAHALSDYLFILVEAGKASDFTERRVCNSCDRWCNPDEAVVKCVACNGAFHLGCVGLNKKPPKGFAWQCAKCNKEALEGREEREKGLERRNRGLKTSALKGGDNPGTPSGIAADALTPSSSKPENREVQMEKIELPLPVNKETVKPIWPYRYFGEYAKYRESLGHSDRFFSHNRIGKAYQADLPECVPLMQSKIRIPSLNKDDKSVTPSPKSGSPREADGASGSAAINKLTGSTPPANQDQPQTLAPGRGTDEELVFRMPTDLTDQEVDNYIKRIQDSMPASIKCSDYLLNRAHEELHKAGYNIAKALQVILPLKAADLGVPAWTEQEIKAFETGITKFGHELHLVQREVKTKTLPEIVTYFYKWKKTRRYAPVYSQFCKKYRPSKQFKSQKHAMDGTALDAEGNLSGDISEDEWRAQQSPSNPNAHHHLECVNCYTTESTKWKVRQRPDLKNEILCFTCGVYWLKYGVARPVPESMRKANREHGMRPSGKRKKQSIEPPASDKDKPKKKSARGKTINAAVARAPRAEEESAPPSPEWDESRPRPCAVCDDLDEEMNNQIVECAGCKLRVHKGCYGLPDQVTVEEGFLCARCQNTRQPECSVLYNCVLCAMVPGPRLSAIKRTVGNNWAHVACAIWIPEIKFGDVNTMEPIECIGIIDKKRWKQNCSICHRHEGACITCSERGCQVAFHVSCAMWSGLEMAVTEQDAVGGAEKGDVVCQAFCAKHDHRKHGLLVRRLSRWDMEPVSIDTIR
ncbi:PHD-zinc-finger like domain-containing protein, partial [Fimicolochytrium jonesii]|uniref:PHD-zinc-finger like domain-containing protein n=1 Tax=Fimicolochytrium jonesii TaxID=1396493 RepID=UPI0022FE88CA